MLYSYYLLNHGSFKGMGIVLTKNVRTFAPVFHGIRFKVRRLFVVMTGNFFYAFTEARPAHAWQKQNKFCFLLSAYLYLCGQNIESR